MASLATRTFFNFAIINSHVSKEIDVPNKIFFYVYITWLAVF